MTRTTYDQVIATNDNGELLVLSDTFVHPPDLYGATGEIVEVITQERYETEQLAERFEEHWRHDAGSTNGTELGLDDWVTENWDELIEGLYDPSPAAETYLDDNGVPFVTTSIVGCGRVFHDNWRDGWTILNPELADTIDKAENHVEG